MDATALSDDPDRSAQTKRVRFQHELNHALLDIRNGEYHAANEKFFNLEEATKGEGWLEIVVGIEHTRLYIQQGCYKWAHALAYEYVMKVREASFPRAKTEYERLWKSLAEVTCLIAAMNIDDMHFPAVDAWRTCLEAVQGIARDALDDESQRPYVSRDDNLIRC